MTHRSASILVNQEMLVTTLLVGFMKTQCVHMMQYLDNTSEVLWKLTYSSALN